MKKLLTILFTLMLASSYGLNLTYYVSNAGNDLNSGFAGSPWRTIAKVNSFALAAGDRVLFNKGDTWHEAIIISRNGTAGNPIFYGAYGTGANPVITGFTSVTSWTNLGSNIWESTASVSGLNDLNLVVINGVNTAMGRTPNTGSTYAYFGFTTVAPWTITSPSVPVGTTNWTGADIVIRHNNFIETRDLVTAHSGTTLTYQSTLPRELLRTGFGFFIENDVRTLDQQNEWYYNPGSKKIRIYSTGPPTGVQVSTLDTLVYMVARSNITFDNISFTGSNRRAFFIGSSSNITIQNCTLDYHGIYAVWGGNNFGVSSNNFRFVSNTVNHTGGQAIDLQNEFTNPYIGYNSFKNTGVIPGMFKIPKQPFSRWDQAYGSIMCTGTNGLHVEYNTFDSSGYTQIHFTGNNTQINNNYCQHWNMILMDGGAVYTWTGPGTPTNASTIRDNILVNAPGSLFGTDGLEAVPLVHGIYTDDNTANTRIYRNTTANIAHSGIYIHQTHESLIRDNTSYNNGIQQVLFEYRDYAIRNDTSKNNIWFAKTLTQTTAKFQSIDRTPLGIGDIPQFFTSLDSNYYTKPIDEVSTPANTSPVEVNLDNTNFHHYTLAQWKTFIGPVFDAHSTKAPKAVTHTDSLRFEYNATSSPVTIPLPYNYIDVRNVSYNGTITLQPWTSAVLIQNGGITGGSNILPVASAGPDQVITLPTNSVSLTGSGTDADGTIVSYAWVKLSGTGGTITSPSSASTTFTGLTAGTYTLQLTVTDNSGGTGVNTIDITVNASNVNPVSNAGPDQSITLPQNWVNVSGSASDADGTVISYAWTQTAGPAAVITSPGTAATSITGMNSITTYTFVLTVTDNQGATNSNSINIVVNSATPPGTLQNFFITKDNKIYRPIL